MKTELSCPVCAYTEIAGNSCPNCDTDLSLIRLLTELPPSSPQTMELEKLQPQQKSARWQLVAALLILMLGIGLGAGGSFMSSQLLTSKNNPSSPMAIKSDRTAAPVITQKTVKQPVSYVVKSGDNLTAITEQFCGKGKSWQAIVKANLQLKTRPDLINIGEVLKIPSCKEG